MSQQVMTDRDWMTEQGRAAFVYELERLQAAGPEVPNRRRRIRIVKKLLSLLGDPDPGGHGGPLD